MDITEDAPKPSPPEHLRLRVHGDRDLDRYIHNGKVNSHAIQAQFNDSDLALPANATVLDFGCGPGRVITWLQPERPDWTFHGTDIDPEAIGWAQESLADVATFRCNEHLPPLDYRDDFFDLVYAISIFTHLPENMQMAWLKELSRITKPGGYLILTTHGETLIPPEYQYVLKSGFHYTADGNTEGLPDFYQTSYQTQEYVKRIWSDFFDVERYMVRGLGNHQDLIVCRKRQPAPRRSSLLDLSKRIFRRLKS